MGNWICCCDNSPDLDLSLLKDQTRKPTQKSNCVPPPTVDSEQQIRSEQLDEYYHEIISKIDNDIIYISQAAPVPLDQLYQHSNDFRYDKLVDSKEVFNVNELHLKTLCSSMVDKTTIPRLLTTSGISSSDKTKLEQIGQLLVKTVEHSRVIHCSTPLLAQF